MYSFGIAVWEMLARSRPIIGKANIDFAILYATVKGRSLKVRCEQLCGLGVSNYVGWGWVGLIQLLAMGGAVRCAGYGWG